MNGQLAIIVAIDCEAALAEKTLSGNLYSIDNHRFAGSKGQGTENLTTYVRGNQIVNWLSTGIDVFGVYPILEGVGGEAVDAQIMIPQVFQSPELSGLGLWWGATVDARVPGIYSYTLHYDLSGVKLSHTLYLDVQRAFSNQPQDAAVKLTSAQAGPRHNDYKSIFPRRR